MEDRKHKAEKKKKKQKSKKLDDDEFLVDLVDVDDFEKEHLRRAKKQLRRAEKRAQELFKLGLDENGEPLDNFSISKYPVRETKLNVPGSQEPLALNPVVAALSMVGLWGLAIWSTVNPGQSLETLFSWRSFVSLNFAWFLLGSKALMFFFVLYITYKYGHVHLGQRNDKPAFSNSIYFIMILAAGTGPSLLTSSISDVMWFQQTSYFTLSGSRSQDEIDMFSINISAYHWTILTWIPYTIVAICVSLASHRFQLPMTFRTCFYPILGAYTWGWMGDVVDALSIVVAVLGSSGYLAVCTFSITAGLKYMGWVDAQATEGQTRLCQNMIIWVITIISTLSVLYGMRGAIQIMSCLAVTLGSLLTLLILIMDDTKFLLNLQVQGVGYLLQTGLLQVNFWTDAFGQLREGSGRAVDGNAADPAWMDSWTIFYYAWTITVAAVVGMFIASISRGRKLWEVVTYGFGATSLYCLVWGCIWAGIGLRQQRQGMELSLLGEALYNSSAHFLVDGSELCYDVPQDDISVGEDVIFTNYLPGVTPVCQFDPDNVYMNVLNSFSFPKSFVGGGMGPPLTGMYVVAIALYFMAYSDSATLMVDSLASNGRKNYHWVRRMIWACTVGAVTTALLSSGDVNTLGAIQSASYAFSLPMAILMCFLPQSVLLLCQAATSLDQDASYAFPDQPEFSMPLYGGIFNVLEYLVSLGKVHESRVTLGMDHVTRFQLVEVAKGFLVPFVSLNQILTAAFPRNPNINTTVVGCYTLFYASWVVLLVASASYPGLLGIVWMCWLLGGLLLTSVRSHFRSAYDLRSNGIADLTSCLLLWPQVLVQMRLHSCTFLSAANDDSNIKG